MSHSKNPFTAAIHGDKKYLSNLGGVSVPIHQSSTFVFKNAQEGADRFAGRAEGYIYTRLGNPTNRALEECIAGLEGGFDALATASGMAAITSVYMTYLEKDGHIISTDSVYGPSRTVIENEFSRFGVKYDFIDTSKVENIEKCLKPETKLVYIETPANPTMSITDIKAIAELLKGKNIPLVVDNTFLSPVLQNPLELGADIVVHSLTKFLNGHSDVVGGVIVTKTEETHKKIKKVLAMMGGTIDPHQSWLILRGIKTLAIRIDYSQKTAIKLADFLSTHPKISWVNYPGLKTHPQHELAKTQMKGFGSMLCFGLKGGLEAGVKLMDNVELCTLAVSLGGIETLIQHPASMTHAGVPKEKREKAGVTDELIRFSVGCEAYEDIMNDLNQALDKC